MTFVVKNKERQKLIRFKERRTIKDKIPSSSRQRSTPATLNITQTRLNLLTAAFDGSCVTRESPPNLQFHLFNTNVLLPSRHKLRLTVQVCDSPLPTQTLEHFLFLDFYYHSTRVKIPKINSFLSMQQPNILLLKFTHILTFSNTIVWAFYFLLFCLLILLLNCSLVFLLFDL